LKIRRKTWRQQPKATHSRFYKEATFWKPGKCGRSWQERWKKVSITVAAYFTKGKIIEHLVCYAI
jgi:hypothetical protein